MMESKTTVLDLNTILLTYNQTGVLPPCPFCSMDALAIEKNVTCAHTSLFIYCTNCGKWAHGDAPYKDE